MTYITVSDVRTASGAPTNLISDTKVEHIISIVEEQTERLMNTRFEPSHRIDVLDGTGNKSVCLDKNPVLRIDTLKTDDSSIDVSTINTYFNSGIINLGEDSSKSVFKDKDRSVIVEYYYGWVWEDTDNRTASTSTVSSGTSVDIDVNDALSFSTNDWINIYGTDGNKEAAQITGINGTTFTVDKLNLGHVSGSVIVKMSIPTFIKKFMEYEAAIGVGINAIGSTYTFNTSYSLGDLSVAKGVPYTHWQSSVSKCIKERNYLRDRIKPRIKIM